MKAAPAGLSQHPPHQQHETPKPCSLPPRPAARCASRAACSEAAEGTVSPALLASGRSSLAAALNSPRPTGLRSERCSQGLVTSTGVSCAPCFAARFRPKAQRRLRVRRAQTKKQSRAADITILVWTARAFYYWGRVATQWRWCTAASCSELQPAALGGARGRLVAAPAAGAPPVPRRAYPPARLTLRLPPTRSPRQPAAARHQPGAGSRGARCRSELRCGTTARRPHTPRAPRPRAGAAARRGTTPPAAARAVPCGGGGRGSRSGAERQRCVPCRLREHAGSSARAHAPSCCTTRKPLEPLLRAPAEGRQLHRRHDGAGRLHTQRPRRAPGRMQQVDSLAQERGAVAGGRRLQGLQHGQGCTRGGAVAWGARAGGQSMRCGCPDEQR